MDLTINLAVANRIWAIDSSIHRAQCGSNSEIEPWTLPSSASLMHSYQGRIQTGGGTGGTCPLQTHGQRKWSGRSEHNMKSHKIAYVTPKNRLLRPRPRWREAYNASRSDTPIVGWEEVNHLHRPTPP